MASFSSATARAYTRITNLASLRAIASRYARGESPATIAEDYQIDITTVRAIAKRHGIPVRPVGRPRIVKLRGGRS